MSFADDAFGWDDFYNLSTAPMVDNNAYMGFLNYDLPLTVCMDSQWTNFDTLLYPLPPFNPCAIEAYTTPHLYDLPQVTIPPTQPFPAVAATCTPLTWASSPSSSRESSPSSGSDTSSERGGSKASNGNAAMEQGVTRGRRSAVRPAPYSINERPGISGAVHTSTSTSAPSGYGAFGPADAAYMESPRRKIQNEFEILSTTLGKLGIKQVRHHPYLTCPVLDCKKGGLNDLLHGGTSASLATTALRLSASASTPTSTPRKPFFSFNELSRHVESVHLAEADLRCSHPGCDVQAKLDKKAGGNGRFSRAGVLRTHLEMFKDHRSHIPEELRVRYKLWKV